MDENVISFTKIKDSPELKIERRRRKCEHSRFVVDVTNREVICGKCKKVVEPIEALIEIAGGGSRFHREIESLRLEIKELRNWNPRLRVIKRLDEMFRRKMYPSCPVCKEHFSVDELMTVEYIGGSHIEEKIKRRKEANHD